MLLLLLLLLSLTVIRNASNPWNHLSSTCWSPGEFWSGPLGSLLDHQQLLFQFLLIIIPYKILVVESWTNWMSCLVYWFDITPFLNWIFCVGWFCSVSPTLPEKFNMKESNYFHKWSLLATLDDDLTHVVVFFFFFSC